MYFILIIMTILGSLGSLNLKLSTSSTKLRRILVSKYFWFGGALYGLSAVLNIYILKYLDYLIVLPFTALTYLWTILFSKFILKEKLTKTKVLGIFFILLGVMCITIK